MQGGTRAPSAPLKFRRVSVDMADEWMVGTHTYAVILPGTSVLRGQSRSKKRHQKRGIQPRTSSWHMNTCAYLDGPTSCGGVSQSGGKVLGFLVVVGANTDKTVNRNEHGH